MSTYLKNTNYEKLTYFGLSHNCKANKYGEFKYFIAIQLKTKNDEIKTTDIILNKDKSVKAIYSELEKEEVLELMNWIVEWFYCPRKEQKELIELGNIRLLGENNRVSNIYSDNLSKEEIYSLFNRLVSTKYKKY